jgi:hypothetical protein
MDDDLKAQARKANLEKARAARLAKREARRAEQASEAAEVFERIPQHSPEPEASPVAEPEDAPLLSEEEIEGIRQQARKIVARDRKKAAMDALLEKELEAIRGKEGMRTGDPIKDEIVNIMIDVGLSSDSITVNGKKYFHGEQATVPRHVAESLREIMWRTQMHEQDISGKPLATFYQRARHTEISRAGVKNAPVEPGRV